MNDRMNGFVFVPGLDYLEHHNMWRSAVNQLYDLWNADRNSAPKLCRILAESWYALSESERVNNCSKSDAALFKKILIEVYKYGSAHFATDVDFLWLAGYMLSLFPFYFYSGEREEAFSELKKEGTSFLFTATQIEPDNLLFRVLYLGTQELSDEYISAKRQLAPQLSSIFSGKSAIEEYFREVLEV